MANISYRINSIRSIDLQLNDAEQRVIAVALIEKAIEIWSSQGYTDETVSQLIETVHKRQKNRQAS